MSGQHALNIRRPVHRASIKFAGNASGSHVGENSVKFDNLKLDRAELERLQLQNGATRTVVADYSRIQ